MPRRPPLRSATPGPRHAAYGPRHAAPAPDPGQPRVAQAPRQPAPDDPGGRPLLDAPSILAGSSILAGASILRGPRTTAPAQPATVAPDPRRRWTAVLVTPPRLAGRAARSGGRALLRWGHRPSGRFVVPLVVILLVLGAAVTGGNYAVRAAAPAAKATAPAPSAASSTPDDPSGVAPSDGDNPPVASGATADSANQGRPQDVVAGWARRMSPAVGISETALKAYGYAALRIAADLPACHLAWTTLAAIGKVESDHGRANQATLGPDGIVLPPIIGPALDGQGGRGLVPDTDGGRYDGDRTYDHAVGPMQFIPGTWAQYQIDADQDGQADPNDINDAALAAGRYLCAGGKDLSTKVGWWGAVLSYNELQAYANSVFTAADDYGQRSRTVA